MPRAHHEPATLPYLDSGHVRVYKAEERATKIVHSVAEALADTLGHTREQYWSHSVVEALAIVLDSFQPMTAIAAAIGYLRKKGFTIPDQEEKPE